MNIPNNLSPLGNNVDRLLPSGYLPCSFLYLEKSDFNTGYMVKPSSGFLFDLYVGAAEAKYRVIAGNALMSNAGQITYPFATYNGKCAFILNSPYYPRRSGGYATSQSQLTQAEAYLAVNTRVKGKLNWKNDNLVFWDLGAEIFRTELPVSVPRAHSQLSIGDSFAENNNNDFKGRLYRLAISEGSAIVRDFVPALTTDGAPVLFDMTRNSAPLVNTGTTAPVPGFTLAQARQLGKLSGTGHEMTISLPVGYEQDEKVQAALSAAAAKGWVLPVQTYTAAAAATYSLRRVRSVVWCRRMQLAEGSYVDEGGQRWQIEWCSAIFSEHGNDPTAYGYIPFDSEEAAAEYWQLQTNSPPENAFWNW